jgi:hypothetical protein
MKAGEVELSENGGATVVGCCVGDDSGDKLARDDRSDEAIEIMSLSVNKLGQNSISSSRSNDRVASNFIRYAETWVEVSGRSFILRTPRNCFCGFCVTDSLAVLRFRPPWWVCETAAADTGVGCCWWALKW